MDHQPFDAGEAIAFLDDVAERFGSLGLTSIERAWDAVWIVCMTLDPRHEVVARTALADVAAEVNRLSIALTPAQANVPTAQALS